MSQNCLKVKDAMGRLIVPEKEYVWTGDYGCYYQTKTSGCGKHRITIYYGEADVLKYLRINEEKNRVIFSVTERKFEGFAPINEIAIGFSLVEKYVVPVHADYILDFERKINNTMTHIKVGNVLTLHPAYKRISLQTNDPRHPTYHYVLKSDELIVTESSGTQFPWDTFSLKFAGHSNPEIHITHIFAINAHLFVENKQLGVRQQIEDIQQKCAKKLQSMQEKCNGEFAKVSAQMTKCQTAVDSYSAQFFNEMTQQVKLVATEFERKEKELQEKTLLVEKLQKEMCERANIHAETRRQLEEAKKCITDMQRNNGASVGGNGESSLAPPAKRACVKKEEK